MAKWCYQAVFLLACHWVGAQSYQEFANSFQLGKKLIDEKNYASAKVPLVNLLKDTPQNPYYKYGAYFYALASYYTSDFLRCEQVLTELLNRYPHWEQADEARLLLALSHLATNNVTAANAVASSIKNGQVRKVFNNAKAASSHQAISSTSNHQSSLVAHVKKKHYHVALLLPFMLSETDASKPVRRFQFVYDMYEGMKLAQEDLASEGIDVQLYPYDTQRSTVTTTEQLTRQKGIDLLIGPLYSNNLQPLSDYAAQHRITIVNPLGTGEELLKDNHTLLVQPTGAIMAQQAALFAATRFQGKTAIVYHDKNPEDSTMAYAYKSAYERNGGFVHLIRSLSNKSSFQRIVDELQNAPRTDSLHVFVAARQPAIAISLVSALLSCKRSIPAITTQEWLYYDQLSYEQLQLAQVHFLIPDFVRNTSTKSRLDKLIVERTNMVPSKFNYVGYETLYFFGKMLHKYGPAFRQYLGQEPVYEGLILPGFDFRNGKENACLAICTFNNGVLEQVFPQPGS
ncbi:MAG: ABC transporter substrate-binding protein [Cytophagales bacterium]|nr:ABC transporter substrate-binding protein [Bernardetiaceae bacterium]MDW8209937.1 ABC transporter substrate-binding protein [Cytophagales bacterium]